MLAVRPHLVRRILLTGVLLLPHAGSAQPRPTLTPADYAKWESIGNTELSRDGRWIAYTITRVDADDELRIREVAADSTIVVPYATNPRFSSDNRWLAYGIGIAEQEREERQRANQPIRSKLGLLDLQTRETSVIDDVAGFDFSGDGRFIAMRGYSAAGRSAGGVDINVLDLATGDVVNFGNIAGHAWQDAGPLLALIVDAENRAGNGVRLYDPRTGAIRTLHADTTGYTGLVWRRGAADLAVLRVRRVDGHDEPDHIVLAWRGLDGARPAMRTLDAARRAGFPSGHRVAEQRELSWSDDGRTLFFGLRPWPVPPVAEENGDSARDEVAGVAVWHAADVDIVPEQKVRANFDRSRTQLAAWHLADDRFVRLGDDSTDVSLSDGRFASASTGRAYDRERMFGPAYRNLYAVDVETGERRLVAERVLHEYGASNTGRYLLYVRDEHFWTYDTRTGTHTNITRDVPTSFIHHEHDYVATEKPPFGTGGWTVGDRSVLLHDRYDVWEVLPDGSRATNLTHGAADRLRHRRVWLNPEDRVVDLSKHVYVAMQGEVSKQSGYGRLRRNAPVERLLLADKTVGRLTRAADADVFYYRIESADESPNLFVGGPNLHDARRVSDTNAFQAEYAWTRSELLDYRSTQGRELQAALFYPADYEPGRRYPMIVYIYESTSHTLHTYDAPSERTAFSTGVFTQNGYFVLRPDIAYRPRDPGVSAVEALLPAIDRALETGMIDSARIGLAGHSWGAYQTAFTITQSDRFAAAVAGAPLANMISMYLSIYWNTGGTDARIFEIQQGRMEVPPWRDLDAYIRNSPVLHIENMNTPLLVAFGDEDGAVDWNQGVELYNAARRAGKDVVMLVYEGENHSLARKANQLDYHRRIMQWFGHYLKGEPAADWMVR